MNRKALARQQPSASTPFAPTMSREIHRSATHANPYRVWNSKSYGQALTCETRLEATVALAMEYDPRVRSVRSQPAVVDLLTGIWRRTHDELVEYLNKRQMTLPQTKRWYPDFEIELVDSSRPVWVEVKRAAELAKEKVRAKQQLAAQVVPRLGFDYLLVLDSDVPSRLAANLEMLHAYRRLEPDHSLLPGVNHFLAQQSHSPESLAQKLFLSSTVPIYVLIAHGQIATALDRPELCDRHVARLHLADTTTMHLLPLHRLNALEAVA